MDWGSEIEGIGIRRGGGVMGVVLWILIGCVQVFRF